MSTHAFVFARGGSKGLPGKNIRPLGGVPLLGHALRVARQVPRIDGLFVSTDDDGIAGVAREFGAEVIERPPELATDLAPEWHAWQHAVRHLRARAGNFDVMLSLPTTSPLRQPQDIESCLDALVSECDAVVCVTPSARSPWFNMVRRAADGTTEVLLKGDATRRQDAGEVYDLTTVAYASRPDFVLGHGGLFQGRVRSVVVPRENAVDIDDSFDFIVAEALYERRRRGVP